MRFGSALASFLATTALFVGACGGDRAARSAETDGGPRIMSATDTMGSEGTGRNADSTAAAPPGPGDTVVQGVVRIEGAAPMSYPVIRAADGGVGVRGDLRQEIAALDGVEVRVRGPAVANQPPVPPRAVDVRDYEIVSVNGERPYVGHLEVREGALWLAAPTQAWELKAVPSELRHHQGAKLWIVGRMTDGVVTVHSFGIIRKAEP